MATSFTYEQRYAADPATGPNPAMLRFIEGAYAEWQALGGEGELGKCPDDRADAVVGERRREAGLERARPFGESVECGGYSGLEQVGEQR